MESSLQPASERWEPSQSRHLLAGTSLSSDKLYRTSVHNAVGELQEACSKNPDPTSSKTLCIFTPDGVGFLRFSSASCFESTFAGNCLSATPPDLFIERKATPKTAVELLYVNLQ